MLLRASATRSDQPVVVDRCRIKDQMQHSIGVGVYSIEMIDSDRVEALCFDFVDLSAAAWGVLMPE